MKMGQAIGAERAAQLDCGQAIQGSMKMGSMHMLDAPLKRVRPSEIEWEPLGTHGLRRKLLGFDEATKHVTSIVGIPAGWVGGGVAHYHHAFEEVYILEGSVTVGGTHYWHKDDYFFRPAHVVH